MLVIKIPRTPTVHTYTRGESMSLDEQLNQDYIAAMKSRDSTRLTVLRLLKTAISNRLVELKQPGGKLDDAEITTLIVKQSKQRRDSIDQFAKAGREDLAEKEQHELKILETYLPRQLSDAELSEAIRKEITASGLSGPSATGKVTGAIMAKYKGQVDGKRVSAMVKELL